MNTLLSITFTPIAVTKFICLIINIYCLQLVRNSQISTVISSEPNVNKNSEC